MTYSDRNLEQIAAAIGCDVAHVVKHRAQFEAAAAWYRLDSKEPIRTAPSRLKRELAKIEGQARRLLRSLGIGDLDFAADGPENPMVVEALNLIGHDRDRLAHACERLARLVTLVEAIEATIEVGRAARKAVEDVREIGSLVIPAGHRGDAAMNGWIEAMLVLYQHVTGQKPRISIGAPGGSNRGTPQGPLIRFLQAAGKPLEIELTPHAWRDRARLVCKSAPLSK